MTPLEQQQNYLTYCEKLAESLEPEEWRTTTFETFNACLQALASDGDFEQCHTILGELRQRLAGLQSSYGQTLVLPEEVTAETVVGHRVLKRGLELWLDALDHALAVQEPPELQAALDQAQTANRLLVAVQLFQEEMLESAQEGLPNLAFDL